MISPLITNEYENRILKIIEDRDKYTQSDLQGVVTLVVNLIMVAGQKLQIQEQLEKHESIS